MSVSNTNLRYGTVEMTLHWIIAALILVNLYLGLSFDDYPRGSPTLFALVQIHKSIGLTVLLLSVLRLAWRLINPVPPLPADMPPLLRGFAHGTHYLLYFLIIAIPLTGWLLVSSSPTGLPTMFWGLFRWPYFGFLADLPRATKRIWAPEFLTVHKYLAWSAIVLLVLHVSGALYHQFFRRDDILKRMIPGTRVTRLEAAE